MADIFEAATAICGKPKKVSNWLMTETMRLLKEHEMDAADIHFSPVHLAKLIDMVDGGVINATVAKTVFEVIFEKDVDPEAYVEEHGMKSVNDEDEIRAVVQKVLVDNAQAVQDYHNGKEKALGALVGQTMKATKGKANPAVVNKLLKELL
jgi:aspartyl-tRNA(Asn)/glutamyl-tRNA(Gln) amidotransferase subunit B